MKPNEKVVPAGAVVVPAAPAGPTAQLARGAVAFGDFVQRVGLAVADAQARLDENMAATAERLSKTSVDVVAVFEQSVDDDGVMSDATAHVQRLPVTSFIMPKPYGWSRVALRAQLNVSEFNGADGFRIDALPAGRPALRSDSTTGTILLEAVLEPRAEVQAPTPLVVQRAPRFRVASQSAMDIVESGRVVGRELAVTIELTRADGTPIGGKTLSFQIADASVTWAVSNGGKTGAEGTPGAGTVTLTLKRTGAAFDAAGGTPQAVQVRIWLGIVTTTVALGV